MALENAINPSLQPPSPSQSIVLRPPESGDIPPGPGDLPPAIFFSPLSSPESVKPAVKSTVVSWILRRKWLAGVVRKADVAARMSAASLCHILFSVMAADKNRGWTTHGFGSYKEYRYCLSVNVLGFVYAGFQAYAEVYHMSSKKRIIDLPLGNYFNFAMDQILAYLLISASSSATTRTNYWVTNWGSDPFPDMIFGSVAVSFLAFVAFAVSSLISAYNLFNCQI